MFTPIRTAATILLRDDRDGIALLTLNNPAARNALSEDLISALATAFDAIGQDPIRARGDRCRERPCLSARAMI